MGEIQMPVFLIPKGTKYKKGRSFSYNKSSLPILDGEDSIASKLGIKSIAEKRKQAFIDKLSKATDSERDATLWCCAQEIKCDIANKPIEEIVERCRLEEYAQALCSDRTPSIEDTHGGLALSFSIFIIC